MFRTFGLIIILSIFNGGVMRAGEGQPKPNVLDPQWPVRSKASLPTPVINTSETAYRLSRARVVLADYPLIRRDFPSLATASELEIDNWLLQHAVMARGQVQATLDNPGLFSDPIPLIGIEGKETFDPKEAVSIQVTRPKEYNRAAVITTQEGLLDIKGAGSNAPSLKWKDGDPRNGHTHLGEAIREYYMQKLVEASLRAGGSELKTVGIYCVIDSGFDSIYLPEPSSSEPPMSGAKNRAGMIFRQGQTRFEDPSAGSDRANSGFQFMWPEVASLRAELELRIFGITSVGSTSTGRSPDAAIAARDGGGINIQGSLVIHDKGHFPGEHIGDMGNMVVAGQFDYSQGISHFWGTNPLIIPGDPDTNVQPDPAIALNPTYFGKSDWQRTLNSKTDKLSEAGYQLAKEIAGIADPVQVKIIARQAFNFKIQPALDYIAKQREAALRTLRTIKKQNENLYGATCRDFLSTLSR